jgi:5-methylcytosine-specific restriction endonuclease McrA
MPKKKRPSRTRSSARSLRSGSRGIEQIGRDEGIDHIEGVGATPDARTDATTHSIELNDGLGAKVLVLNRHYLATRVISAKRAFILLAREAAEVIHADDGSYANYDFATWAELSELRKQFEPDRHDWVKTVRFDIAVPRIIRLTSCDKLPAQRVKLNRRNLFARDHNQCQYCGSRFPTSELSIDHVLPRSQNGPDTWENLVCACVKCNSRKGGRTPEQAHMKLIRKPVRPRRNPLISIKLSSDKYASWKAFLDDAYWSVELR